MPRDSSQKGTPIPRLASSLGEVRPLGWHQPAKLAVRITPHPGLDAQVAAGGATFQRTMRPSTRNSARAMAATQQG